MSLQQIYDDLDAALSGRRIELKWSTAPGLEGVLAAIGIAAEGSLALSEAELVRGAASVVLTGNAGWRGFNWSATLTGEEAAGGASRFTLALQGQDAKTPWTLGTSFAGLPRTRRIREEDGVLVLGPSVLAPLVVESPRISVAAGGSAKAIGEGRDLEPEPRPTLPVTVDRAAPSGPRPRLEGWLQLKGSELQGYVPYLGAERLRLDGHLDFRPGAQLIELRAVAPAAVLPIATEPPSQPGLGAAEIGLRLESAYPDAYSLAEKPEEAVMSAAVLYVKVRLGSKDPVRTEVSTPLLQGDDLWPLAVALSEPLTLPHAVTLILELFGVDESSWLSFPLDLGLLSKFGLSGAELGIRPPLGGRTPGLDYAAVQLRSTEEWDPPVPFVKVRELGTGWVFHWYGGATFITGNVWGKLTLFEGIELLASATIPDFDLVARTEAPIAVPLAKMLKAYLGGSAGLSEDLKVTEALVEASPTRQTYHGTLMVDGIMEVKVGSVTFSLDRILGEITSTQAAISGSISGFASILVPGGAGTQTKAVFVVTAAYGGGDKGSWTFEGGLADGTLSLLDFAWGLFGSKPAPELPTVELTELWLTYSTADGNPYSARGAVAVRWEPTLLGLKLSLVARARYAWRPRADSAADRALALVAPHRVDLDKQMVSEGELYGTFSVNRLAITAGLSFVDKETLYLFEVAWGSAALRAVTVNVPDPDGKSTHQAIAITLREVTLGSLVEGLLRLANPNLDYRLEAPWSVLNSVDLSRFTLTIDPKLQTVTVTYKVDLDLVFMSVTSVGVRYDRSGGEPSVNFVLTGKLLGQDFEKKPLTWDAARDAPPEIPGKGTRLFELRYLGLGQHVTLSGLTKFESVGAVIAELRKEMQPLEDRNANPLTQSKLSFDESSQWMLGLDFSLIETVSLGLVMHDPDLYGLVVKLEGEEAGSLGGLEFELLYKRVTDTVGVFRVRLQVPEAFRQINLGPVAVTLGVITVDVFTNGNFLADLGFPHERNFSSSFGLEAGPFIGSGGIYFGVLDGATSKRVPAIANGSFDPVLELGIGISAGVGRTFEKGPLKAGLYVQMEAILEGVLGWFSPTDTSASRALYYWGQGTAGLVGKLYGSVDFKVIRAAVSVEAHATVTVTFAAHQATVVELDVGVEVSAEIEVFWVSVSFHFELELEASFTIGESSRAPWILAADQGGRGQPQLGSAAPSRRLDAGTMRELTRAAFLRERGHLLDADGELPYHLSWNPHTKVFPSRLVKPITIKLLPAFSVDEVPVAWPGQQPQAESSAYRIAMLALIDNGVPPQAGSIAAAGAPTAAASATATTGVEASFNLVIEAMLRWSLSALGLDPIGGAVTAGQLKELARQLEMPAAADKGFAMKNLAEFFAENLEFRLSAIPSGEPKAAGGTAFPIPPPLGWDSDEKPDKKQRRFAAFNTVDANYEREVAESFAELDPGVDDGGKGGSGDDAAEGTADPPAESMATFVFRDWFLLVAKAALQAARETIAAFPYQLKAGEEESLAAICGEFGQVGVLYEKHLGDTVDEVARAVGMGLGELLALNPGIARTLADAAVGAEIEVLVGATPEGVAAANPDWFLVEGREVPLGDLPHQVRDGDTLAAIAQMLGAPLRPWLESKALLDAGALLRTAAPLALPEASFANPGGLDLTTVAALLYARFRGTAALHLADAEGVPLVEWYATAISSLSGIPSEGPLPATVSLPRAYLRLSDPLTWTTLPGDTLWGLAAMAALAQNPAGDPGFAKWLQEVRARNTGPEPLARVVVPATATAVQPGETLRALAARLPLELPDPQHQGEYLERAESFRRIVAPAPLLAPLAPLTVPACVGTTRSGETISDFAQRYDLSPADLGRRAATFEGLLTPSSEADLTIPHPAKVPIGPGTEKAPELLPALLRTRSSAIAGQTSRFLLHGLRIGAPKEEAGVYRPTGKMSGLFELTGQQLAGPAPSSEGAGGGPADPALDRMVLTVKVFDPAATWLKLYESTALAGDEELEPLLDLNPGLRHRERTAGIVALTDPVAELAVHITEEDLSRYPARKLAPVFTAPPGPLPSMRKTPVHHGLQQRILWQSTESIALPNPGHAVVPVVGAKTIWPFGADLRAAARAFPAADFALQRADPALGPGAEPVALSCFAWATSIALRVRRIQGQPNTYELLGADATGRDDLLGLWRYLTDPSSADSATLHLFSRPAASTGLPNGLASVPLKEAATFLIKTNLSTETAAPDAVAADGGDPPTFGEYYARLADSSRFLTLLWEGSVVGGAGYWLHCTAAAGGGLPESIFAEDGTAELSLLVLLSSQAGEPPARKLHPFTNCAVVGESVDAGAANVFAVAAGGVETRMQATVAPGNVAFGMALEKPAATATDAQSELRRLYSLLGYSLGKTDAFGESRHPGTPVGPQVPAVAGEGRRVGDEGTWDLFQVVPVHRFAKRSAIGDVAGLPLAVADPYAGIERSGEGPANAEVLVDFHDVLGNSSLESGAAAAGGPFPVTLPVGYTDPVIGVGGWPATTTSFRVAAPVGGGAGARLLATLALQASAHLAAPGENGSAAAVRAGKQLDRFRQVYYQAMQPDLTVALLTTLAQESGEPARQTVPVGPLRDFAAGACAWLESAAALLDEKADVGASPTLNEVSARYGVGLDQLAAANAELPLDKIFAAAKIPAYVPFREGATVAELCSEAAVLLAKPENTALPLRPGVEIAVPKHSVTVPSQGPKPTLADLAAANGVSVPGLLCLNLAKEGLLEEGARFECEGVSVEVKEHPEVSLEDVAKTFQDKGVQYDAPMVAGANADVPGLLRPHVTLELDRTLVLAGETLAENHTGVAATTLAEENVGTANLLPAGVPLFVGDEPAATATMEMPLTGAAKVWGIQPEQLLGHNGSEPLLSSAAVAVPGQATLPGEAAALRVPYRIPVDATLAGVAALFLPAGTESRLALASANLNLPGVLAGGRAIEVGGQQVEAKAGDSFATLLARFKPPVTLAALVAAIGAAPGYLAPGALLLCPPARLAGGGAATLKAAGERYGLDAAAIASANASLAGIVVAGAELKLEQTKGEEVTVKTGAADSLNSLVWRFAQKGVSTTLAEIAVANEGVPLLRPEATLLLAPAPCELEAPVGAKGWHFPGAVFPLQAWLELARDPKLVDPSIRREAGDDGPVTRDRTALAPSAVPGKDRALALEGFARECQRAVPALRVATGKVAGDEETDVWAVVFAAGQIGKVAISPPAAVPGKEAIPQYYALAPLDNSLVSRAGVTVSPLKEDGTLGDPELTDYQGIDLETWARRLLADVDLFVSGPYASALYQTPQRQRLEAVLEAKGKLADAIVEGLDYVLELGQPAEPARQDPQPPDWLAAGETLRQRLLTGLATGYGTGAVMQYRAEVTSPWPGEETRLAGAGKLPSDPTGEQRRVRLSGAKTSLASKTSYVNFMVDVAEEGHERSLDLPFEYAISELEFNVAEVVSGYRSSDWLSLVTPFDEALPSGVSIDLGKPQVPLPLRSYPPLPALLDQGSAPSTPEPKSYREALDWDYTASFQHQSMASDQLVLEVEFNRPPAVGADLSPAEDLFSALARYVAVAPALWNLLGALPDASLPVEPRLENAIGVFSTLVNAVADAWAVYWNPSHPSPGMSEEGRVEEGDPLKCTFTATLTPRYDDADGRWYWSEMLLSRDQAGLPWPLVSCFTPGGPAAEMKPGQETPAGMPYAFPAGVEAFGLVGYEFRFSGLPVATHQNASSRIRVVRNAQLLKGGPPTREGFVYQTPTLAFPSPTTPLLSWNQAFAIGDWSSEARKNPLGPVLEKMLEGAPGTATIACAIRYGYELGGSAEDPLVSELPFAYRPTFPYDQASTVGEIIDRVQRWKNEQSPDATGGEWVFGLSLYSSVDGNLGRPLLELSRLRSRIPPA
jgi:hypothetical protein